MRSIVIGFVLLVFAQAASASVPPYVLRSSALQVTISVDTGAILEIQDLARPASPQVFGLNEDILKITSGDLAPVRFIPSDGDPISITLTSTAFQSQTASLPLGTTIRYRLLGSRLLIDYCFEASARSALDNGLNISISSSVWDTLVVRNHYSGEDPYILSKTNPVRRMALNQVYEFHNSSRNLRFVFANPYHSLVTITSAGTHAFLFKWQALVSTPPPQAVDPKGPPLASVLTPGVQVHRQVELIVSHRSDAPSNLSSPIAYFSPFPNGYDQVIAMTFDDIPFGRWVFPVSGHDTSAAMEQYLIRLLEDHPKMKMGWIILPDEILSQTDLANPDYPPGKWWLAHSKHRILTAAPAAYMRWLRNIDRDSIVYGYENRVHFGNHGYHHTPEMKFGANYEFQSYDPVGNDSTFATILKEYSLLGLHATSCRWIRFPGYYFTRSAVESLIKCGYVLFDYWGIYDKLPWMQFYTDYGRVWGIGTYWEGDTPSPYLVMDKILRAGKLCHTAGHPGKWFDGDPVAAYQTISQEFLAAENNFPDLGYLFPDEVGYFANETSDIHDIEDDVECDGFSLSFVGSAMQGQTIMVEWPAERPDPKAFTIDGLNAPSVVKRGHRFVLTLPAMAGGEHVLRVSGDLCTWYDYTSGGQAGTPSVLVLSPNYPNPFNPMTSIGYGLPRAAHVTLTVYNSLGEKIIVLVDRNEPPGRYMVQWDGRDGAGAKATSGIYFCRLEAGSDTRVRKLVLVR